jgi:hypothetical protein
MAISYRKATHPRRSSPAWPRTILLAIVVGCGDSPSPRRPPVVSPVPLPISRLLLRHSARATAGVLSVFRRRPGRSATSTRKTFWTSSLRDMLAAVGIRRSCELTMFAVVDGNRCWATPEDSHPLAERPSRPASEVAKGEKVIACGAPRGAHIVADRRRSGGQTG